MTTDPTACDRAIARHRAAVQALSDVFFDRKDSPVVLSRELTGAPTMETLRDELDAAAAEVDAACGGKGPSQ